ncbi:MAG: hypothetical protein H8D23_29600 [Candidatus Brocadiales bacterium]|nr:hypothetical protein [Candidatus Brocadiales bacterium]
MAANETVYIETGLSGSVQGESIGQTKRVFLTDVTEINKVDVKAGVLPTGSLVSIWGNSAGGLKGSGTTDGGKYISITNVGSTSCEIIEEYDLYTEGTDAYSSTVYISRILSPNAVLSFPTDRAVGYTAYSSACANAIVTGTDSGSATDGAGDIETDTFFGKSDTGGIAPGSISIAFYDPPYQELGMTNSTNKAGYQYSTTDTGLTADTLYDFGITIDGDIGGPINVEFTTDSSDTTWGNGSSTSSGVIKKINDAIEDAYEAGNISSKPVVSIVNGDIRFTGALRFSTSSIVLAVGTGSSMFDVGNIPAIGDIDAGVDSDDTDFTQISSDNWLLDQGNGYGTRTNGGNFDFVEYDSNDSYKEDGNFVMTGCPPYAGFKMWYSYNSAQSGEKSAADNSATVLKELYGTSLSQTIKGNLQVIVLN